MFWPHVGVLWGLVSIVACNYFTEPYSLLWGGLLEGGRGTMMMARPGISRSQDFFPGAGDRFWLGRNFTNGCRTWDPGGRAYDVLVRFFLYMVYIDSSQRDTFRNEWPLVSWCHLVICLVYCLWLEDEDCYGYIIMITVITLTLTLAWINVLIVYACSSL
jgi:hypothetical protein